MGVDENGDPMVISMIRENASRNLLGTENFALYRLIIRLGYVSIFFVSESFINDVLLQI